MRWEAVLGLSACPYLIRRSDHLRIQPIWGYVQSAGPDQRTALGIDSDLIEFGSGSDLNYVVEHLALLT